MSDTSAKLTHEITIERDFISGDIHVQWEDLSYSEILGMLEFAKLLVLKEYMEDPNTK
jgi:hypothetical protein